MKDPKRTLLIGAPYENAGRALQILGWISIISGIGVFITITGISVKYPNDNELLSYLILTFVLLKDLFLSFGCFRYHLGHK